MTVNDIKSYMAEVKQPVWVHLADGKRFFVKHQDYMAFSPFGGVFIFKEGGGFILVNQDQITSIEKQDH